MKTTALESAVNSSCNNQNNLSTTFSPHFQQPKLQSYQQQHRHQPQHQQQWNNFRVRMSRERKTKTNCFVFLNKKYWDIIVGVSCCQFIVVEIKSSAIWRHVFLSDPEIRTNYYYHYLLSLSFNDNIFPTCDPYYHRTSLTEQSGPQTPRRCLFMTWSQYITLILCPITR